jgi:hypothetical protein
VNETTKSSLELLLSANLGSEKAEVDHLWCANLRRELNAYFPNFPQLPQNTPFMPITNFDNASTNNKIQLSPNSNHAKEEMLIVLAHYRTAPVGITRALSMLDQIKQEFVSSVISYNQLNKSLFHLISYNHLSIMNSNKQSL